jgi:hypothetical protein
MSSRRSVRLSSLVPTKSDSSPAGVAPGAPADAPLMPEAGIIPPSLEPKTSLARPSPKRGSGCSSANQAGSGELIFSRAAPFEFSLVVSFFDWAALVHGSAVLEVSKIQ